MATQVNDQFIHSRTKDRSVCGHVLMNQCRSLLTHNNDKKTHKILLQRICATSIGKLVPLRYRVILVVLRIFMYPEQIWIILGCPICRVSSISGNKMNGRLLLKEKVNESCIYVCICL